MRDNSARTWRVLSPYTTWRVNCPFNGPSTLSNSRHDAHAVLLCSNRQALDNQTRSRIFLQFRFKKHNKDLRRERTNSQDQNVLCSKSNILRLNSSCLKYKDLFTYHHILTCHNWPSYGFHSSLGRSNTPRLLWSVQSPEFLYRRRPDEQNPSLVYLHRKREE